VSHGARAGHGSYDGTVLPSDEHDGVLVANCHPGDWVNPAPAGRYNLVVVGAGTAGLVSAGGLALLGARVALVERRLTGGDCLVYGCVPSKGVVRAARAAFDARDAGSFGVRIGGEPSVDFAAAMERMRRLRAEISPNDSVRRFRDMGVDVFLGDARFTAPDAVDVDGATLRFSRAVIATGARPRELDVEGLDAAGYYTNETIFTLTERPRRLVVVGAGPIGCELAHAFRRLGSEVTLVANTERVLDREDADVAAIVRRQMEREGVRVLPSARLVRARREGAERLLTLERETATEELACDAILVAVGREPNVEGLGLERARVRYGPDGVQVDEYQRTSNRRIYAAGDVCSRFKFTHAADAMARNIWRNAFLFGRRRASDLVIPWCTYTDPEVAHVGMYEAEAREAGRDVATLTQSFEDVDRAILDGEREGLARVHYDRRSKRILGATIVARHAGEMIGELTLAIRARRTVGDLAETIHPYPTQADAIRKLGDQYLQTTLTPLLKGVLAGWFRWNR
jgi:pyruvate/2-oxoglutarate dehydrogenase complex dihydrolipoamide dehydrogenase (E3) component